MWQYVSVALDTLAVDVAGLLRSDWTGWWARLVGAEQR